MDNNEKVLSTLQSAGSPMKSAEIATQSGLDKKDVDKAIKILVKENKISSPKRCYYSAE